MSSQIQAWPGRSHVSIFVRSLHLLDLDQLDDWPEVTIQSLGAKASLQLRIRCVEWSLYRLFELYDAGATRDKLRPFFPPTSSLQSVNLRAALLRQLTELKKDGVLGPTVILRKTMLDECKGDKFEELLATFSMMILKKRLAPNHQQLGLGSTQTGRIVPLVLSYRKAIQRDLEKRTELKLRATQQKQTIDARIKALSAEAAALSHREAPQIPEHAESLARIVRENWIGDHAWIDTILYGVPPSRGADPQLLQDDVDADSSSALLGELDARVEAQSARLAHWQSYLNTLQERHQKQPVPHPSAQKFQSKPKHFARHQNLVTRAYNLRTSSEQSSGNSTALATAEHDLSQQLKPRHATLLQSLDRELTLDRPKLESCHDFQSAKPVKSRQIQLEVDAKAERHLLARSSSSASSDVSSQRTVVEEDRVRPDADSWSLSPPGTRRTPVKSPIANLAAEGSSTYVAASTSLEAVTRQQLLLERTRASLAQFETPRGRPHKTSQVTEQANDELKASLNAQPTKQQSDRASLLERTRHSMSRLSNVLDENYQPRSNPRSKRPAHARSKTAIHLPQRPRLERAWSEESLASTATKEDNLDVEADYEDVFKSRPRLAMSPNLSPQRTSSDLWLESQLEEGMNKLTIASSPDN